MRLAYVALLCCSITFCQEPEKRPAEEAAPEVEAPKAEASKPDASAQSQRANLNLMGQTNANAGESRRNENVQFNLIDTATVKELLVRLGPSATLTPAYPAEQSFWGAEYGNPPRPGLQLPPARIARWHGSLFGSHLNSVFSARSFFQASSVKPARENEYGFNVMLPAWRKAYLTVDGSQQKLRGNVNGNVLVPLESERTPLTTDPALRAIVEQYFSAYPLEAPNRTDIDPRALNTNAPQRINTHSAALRLDQEVSDREKLALRYQYTFQQVDAFQLVKGQNPDTDTRNHAARAGYTLTWRSGAILDLTAGLDRLGTLIRPEPNAVGPTVNFGNAIAGLGPAPPIPIDRAQNSFRYGARYAARVRGNHRWSAGGEAIRLQVNGLEQDGNRGIITFGSSQGRDVITNLRLGRPLQYIRAVGETNRGYRQWLAGLYIQDDWKVRPGLDLSLGMRWEPISSPSEVNGLDGKLFPCDCNNLGPRVGLAWRTPRGGVFRAAYSVQYGQIFATTYGQIRLSPPGSNRIAVQDPNLVNPLAGVDLTRLSSARVGQFLISPDLVAPYTHLYNLSWEPVLPGPVRVQVGYVGSRALKLFQMWFENRGRPVAGIPLTNATINQRRPDASILERFRILNASRGYYDAARVSVILPRWKGITVDAGYWFSKAIDLGNDYTATMSGSDARLGRSQAEQEVHADLKGRSSFDQPHGFLTRATWQSPNGRRSVFRNWQVNTVILAKNGTPFSIESGSDATGFGNVDGQGGDRVHVLNPEILGRTISHPDLSRALLPASEFSFIQPGELRGNIGRNTFRRARISNVNASLARTFALGDRALTVRAESINLLNTPQFAEPTKELSAPSFARITNTLNDGRTLKFSVRFGF